jgi:ribosome biogenesis GTPase
LEGGVYTLALQGGREVEAKLRGRLKQETKRGDRIVIGDRVEVAEAEGGAFTIDALLPRRSTMTRRAGVGRKARVLAANVDRVIVVVAVEPPPWTELIDRLLVVAEASSLPAVLVVNKMDLPDAEQVVQVMERYRAVGYPVLGVSARRDLGMEPLRALVCQGTSAFMGPSGVGKSTLLNVIEPGLMLRTGELSGKGKKGRHTTVSSRLIPLGCGGSVADTPGFSDVGQCEVDPLQLDLCFPEMRGLRDECRFGGCAHVKEPGCAVRAAVAAGTIAGERYDSYVALRREAEAARAY